MVVGQCRCTCHAGADAFCLCFRLRSECVFSCRLYLRHSTEPIPENVESCALVYAKYYDAARRTLTLVRDVYVSLSSTIDSIHPAVAASVGLPDNAQLVCNEELQAGKYPPIDTAQTFQAASLQNGDVLVFSLPPGDGDGVVDTETFMADMHNCFPIEFRDLDNAAEPGFTLQLDARMRYRDFVGRLAEHLQHDSNKLQLTQPMPPDQWRAVPVRPSKEKIASTTSNMLKTCLRCKYSRAVLHPVLYYQKIQLPIEEMERLDEVTVYYLDTQEGMKIQKHSIFVESDASADGVIKQLCQRVGVNPAATQCRLVTVDCKEHQVTQIARAEHMLRSLLPNRYQDWDLRVEKIPIDQQTSNPMIKLVQVQHIFKSAKRVHGIPFLFVIRQGETIADLRSRLQEYTKVADDEFAKWKLGYAEQKVEERGTMVDTEVEVTYKADDDIVEHSDFEIGGARTWIVLDHLDKVRTPAVAIAFATVFFFLPLSVSLALSLSLCVCVCRSLSLTHTHTHTFALCLLFLWLHRHPAMLASVEEV